MVFSSQIFLFFFLPLVLLLYFICHNRAYRNTVLVLVSLFFYWYGEGKLVLLLLFSITMNWGLAFLISRVRENKKKKCLLIANICLNLGLLGYYKYYDFFVENVNAVFHTAMPIRNIILPIGISFFTFQAMSYCIDVYRDEKFVQKQWTNVALYISFFPQLIAGPIVRFSNIAKQITGRKEEVSRFNEGVVRFVYGLGKKVIIANVLAAFVDDIYLISVNQMSVITAWQGAIGYTLQIYFDFSGYSDMAIGLGKMFGFEFFENFNYPYCSTSVSEFWRRWHISLGSWFRDYVYIPLGGNRAKTGRIFANLLIVWLLTGVWHGANWTFILWGVIYGILIIGERIVGFEKKNIHGFIKRLYTLFFVNILWVLFRSDSVGAALGFVKAMFGMNGNVFFDGKAEFYLKENVVIFVIAILASTPLVKMLKKYTILNKVCEYGRPVIVSMIFMIAVSYIVKGSYNPFIYFNF